KVSVVGVDGGTITLRQLIQAEEEEHLATSAVWGVSGGESYGQLGVVLSESNGEVTREFTPLIGEFVVGQEVLLERTAFPHDPFAAHAIAYEEVVIPGPLGGLGAWHISPTSAAREPELWAVLVHGRTSNRETSLKILDDLARLGVHSLTIDYRNDVGAPSSESGYYDFGVTEWEDVEAAVGYAVENGAASIILVGYSMGGGIVVNFQLKSDLAKHTAGMILDAPMLDFGKTVDFGAKNRSVPKPITRVAKFFAQIRFGIDWRALDYLSRVDEIDVPVLLIHGDTDDTVPVETSVRFAEKSPDLVDLHRFTEAGHVESWNYEPARYEQLLAEFVSRIR
ncbi:MAG: alpha/beta fold hydrolase, partial [Chloroflexi bacterium]|nr:alpha/beta fold hydrolase [Chloroflexota bacterium]